MLSRYYSYSQFEDYFKPLLNRLDGSVLSDVEIGKSVQGRSIYGFKIGSGSIKVLAWSQMHGNESTTTRAICKLLLREDLGQILENITLYIIPILNPDGADDWIRVNANNVDLNRDAVELTQPESIVLRSVFEEFAPDYCFNLHGQRTIYGSADGEQPAQMSFLAPAGDENKTITTARLKSMEVINSIYKILQNDVSGIIGKYKDDFNINCVGDYMVSKDVPTILFEAGHAGDDYSRNQVTDLMVTALESALKSVNKSVVSNKDQVLEGYHAISNMSTSYVDILIKNHKSINGTQTLSIQYHEQLRDKKLFFAPILVGINSKDVKNGHRVIDLKNCPAYKNDIIVDENFHLQSDSLNIIIFC